MERLRRVPDVQIGGIWGAGATSYQTVYVCHAGVTAESPNNKQTNGRSSLIVPGDTMKRGPDNILPQSLAPRGLSREQAAAYVGVSPSLFDTLVKDGRMPGPKRINARTVWDRLQLDAAFAALPSNEAPVNPWDEIAA